MTTVPQISATPTKLRTGEWGCKVHGSGRSLPYPGDCVTITTRSGKSWEATLADVVYTGETFAIFSVSPRRPRPATSASAPARRAVSRAQYCGYADPVTKQKCNARNGQCCDCA